MVMAGQEEERKTTGKLTDVSAEAQNLAVQDWLRMAAVSVVHETHARRCELHSVVVTDG